MKIFGIEFGKKRELPVIPASSLEIDEESSTIRPELTTISAPANKLPANIPPIKSTVLSYNGGPRSRDQFSLPEYDLAIIGRAEDTDSYVAQAHMKKAGLLFKEGYEFVGPNPKTIQYLKLRFQQIARASNTPAEELLKSIGSGLVKKSNVFLHKKRKESASGGRRRVLPGTNKELEPIAGYFIIPSETMQYDADEFGKIRRWKQVMPGGGYVEYRPEDIAHFTFNKKEGMIFGTPTLVPVMDDVRALRRIEENIEMLIYQHLFPLFHYQVGSDDMPATVNEYGEDEIQLAKREIEYMPSEGGIVTSHRHKISLIGAENRSLRAESYLNHFKKRVFSGLGVSAVDMGEGECFDEHTQTLTENGWKFHWQIDHTKEKIATYNPETRQIEFHLPQYKYEGFYQGKMIQFKSARVDILVTPKHEMWVLGERDTSWHKKTAREMCDARARRYTLLESTSFSGNPNSKFTGMAPEIYLLAGIVAKCGEHDPVNNNIVIKPNKRVYDPLLNLFSSLEIKWRVEVQRGNRIFSIPDNLYEGLLKEATKRDRVSRMQLLSGLPLVSRKLFVSSFAQSFCSIKRRRSKNGGGLNLRPPTYREEVKTPEERDLMQEMLISAGYSCSIKNIVNEENGTFFSVTTTLGEYSNITRCVYRESISEVDYSGIVYCYNVPNHLFLTRRNGKTSIQGNTANRATSDTMSRNLVDSVKDMQRHIETQFTDFIINELLLESTFGPEVLNEENRVQLRFKEIDLDYQIKKANHQVDMFTKNILSHHEARIGQGLQPMRIPTPEEVEDIDVAEKFPEWYATFFKLIDEPKALILSADEPYSPAAKALAYNRSTEITGAENDEAASDSEKRELAVQKARQAAKPASTPRDNFLKQRFDDLAHDAISLANQNFLDRNWLRQIASLTETAMISELRSRSISSFASGFRSINSNPDSQIDATIRSRSKIESRINFFVQRLIRNILGALDRQNIAELEKSVRIQKVRAIFDSLRHRTDYIFDVEIRKARNLGILEGAKALGYQEWSLLVSDDTCESCKLVSETTFKLTDSISLDDVPPLHPNSRTKIKFQ